MIGAGGVSPWHVGSTGALAGAKNTSLEGGPRVPGILRWPAGIRGGQLSANPTTSMDVHATILDVAGAAAAPKPLDGRSLLPVWSGAVDSLPEHPYFYFIGRRLEAVRLGNWKLRIAPPADDWGTTERDRSVEPVLTTLHDLSRDPYEQFNRAADFPERVEELREVMAAAAEEMGAVRW